MMADLVRLVMVALFRIAWKLGGQRHPKVMLPIGSILGIERDEFRSHFDRVIRRSFQTAGILIRKSGRGSSYVFSGDIEGYHVTVRAAEPVEGRAYGSHYTVDFRGGDAVPPGLKLDRASSPGAVSAPELTTGDPRFDSIVRVSGPRARSLAIIGDAARRRVIASAFEGDGISFEDGCLRWTGDFDFSIRPHAARLRRMRDVAAALLVPADSVPALLVRHVRSETLPLVRQNCLRAVLEKHRDHDETRILCSELLGDADATVRVLAASGAGEAGVPVLAAVAADETASVEPRVEAIGAIETWTDDSAARTILLPLLASSDEAVRGAAAAALGTAGGPAPGVVDALALRLNDPAPLVAEAAARALGRLGDPAAETPLLRALGNEPGDLAIALVRALANVGSPAAVEPLRSLRIPFNFIGQSELKSTVLEAIAAIQSRIPGGEHGLLTLSNAATDAMGALTMTSEAGRLELATDEALDAPPPVERRAPPTASG